MYNIIGFAAAPQIIIVNCGWGPIIIVTTYIVILFINSKLYCGLILLICIEIFAVLLMSKLLSYSITQNIVQHAADKIIKPGMLAAQIMP